MAEQDDSDPEVSSEIEQAQSSIAREVAGFVSCKTAALSVSCHLKEDVAEAAIANTKEDGDAGTASDLETMTGHGGTESDEYDTEDDLEDLGAQNRAARAFRDPVRQDVPEKEVRVPLTKSSIQDKVKQSMAKKKGKTPRQARNKTKDGRGKRESCQSSTAWG